MDKNVPRHQRSLSNTGTNQLDNSQDKRQARVPGDPDSSLDVVPCLQTEPIAHGRSRNALEHSKSPPQVSTLFAPVDETKKLL